MVHDPERRAARRIAFPCRVECTPVGVTQSPVNPRISELSATGAFIDTLVALPRGAVVRLRFRLPSGEISCSGEVVHDMPQFGMGIKFVGLTPQARGRIEQLVHERD